MSEYNVNYVVDMYKEVQRTKGREAYRYVSEVLEKAKDRHSQDYFERNPNGKGFQQSWNNIKGNCFQEILQYIITETVTPLGLRVVKDDDLKVQDLTKQLDAVKRNVLIDYGKFGMQFPDADIIIYNPKKNHVIAVISCKTSLRERIAQTCYWKFKFLEREYTEHIKMYLVTPDSDNTLKRLERPNKGRVMAETDLDGTYVLTKENLQESENVKLFEHFIEDFKKVIEETQ